jgi:hypothetical protein
MRLRSLSLVLVAGILLTACQDSYRVRDEAAGGFRQLQGGSLLLKQAVTVPAGKARVFIQSGRVAESGGWLGGRFDQYLSHCALEIDAVDHAGFTIRPDSFRITRVQHSLTPVVMRTPLQVAARVPVGSLDSDGSGAYHEGYHLWLASAAQPAVRRLSCYGVYAEPPDLAPPTLAEMRAALGDLAEIRP